METTLEFWFDYVDPASWLVEQILSERFERAPEGGEAGGPLALPHPVRVVRRPLELRPPPRPPLDPAAPVVRAHFDQMAAEMRHRGVELRIPPFLPWTRKAHELALFAAEKGCFAPLHRAMFDGFALNGLDIGRIDVLVELAAQVGLDPVEARVVLDVDRYTEEVAAHREEAFASGIRGLPVVRSVPVVRAAPEIGSVPVAPSAPEIRSSSGRNEDAPSGGGRIDGFTGPDEFLALLSGLLPSPHP